MRREGLNEHDAFERAVMADVPENATPEQVDATYGAGAHDEVLAAAAPENGVTRQAPGAQGRVAHGGGIGGPKVSRSEAGRAGSQDEPTREARTPAQERAPRPHQVDENASGLTPTRALARDDREQIVDKWREVRKPLPINTSAQRKDVIRGYRRELSKLGLLNAKTEGEVRNRLVGLEGESPEVAKPDIIERTGAAPPGVPPPSATRTADLIEPRPQGGVFDSKGNATLPREVQPPGDARRMPTRVRDKAGGVGPASPNDNHGAPSGAVSDSGEPSRHPAENEAASAIAAQRAAARGQRELPGTGEVSDADVARRRAARPLKPRREQEPSAATAEARGGAYVLRDADGAVIRSGSIYDH